MGAARPRKDSDQTLSVLSNFVPLEVINIEPSKFLMPSKLGARPLGSYSSVRSSSNLCWSWETECVQCSTSTPPFIPEDSIEHPRSLAALQLEPVLILRYQQLEIDWHVSPIAKSIRAASSSTMLTSPQKYTRNQSDTAEVVETKKMQKSQGYSMQLESNCFIFACKTELRIDRENW